MPTKDTPAIKVVINVVFTDPKDNQSYILNWSIPVPTV
jgi:hypothetical protein